jgi:ABC-type transporter Mla subunit MlaD
MAATARLVVQMTPQEKQALDSRAKRAGVSTAEFVRRRLDASDDLGENREEIESLLTVLEGTAPQVLQSVDSAMATIAAMAAKLDDLKGGARS